IFDHVVIIVMENEGIYDICRQNPPPCSITGPAPYVAGLANNYTIGSHYLSLINTSQPNYVALLSGSMQGCTSGGCPVITAPNLMWLTPNDWPDMRGSGVCGTSSLIGPGNAYLAKLVPLILNSRTFTTTRSALFITFDEGNRFCPLNGSAEDCVYDTWVGPV